MLTPSQVPDAPARDERAARRTLRTQIARLELQLARAIVDDLQAGARGRLRSDVAPAPGPAPRLLGLGDLEERRDELVARIAEVEDRRRHEERNRELLAAMYRDPAAHRYVRLETTDLAERGCRVYEVVPRFGLVGILGGWWRVKVSSGCPLARVGAPSAGDEAASPTGGPRAARPEPGGGPLPASHARPPRARPRGGPPPDCARRPALNPRAAARRTPAARRRRS